MKEENCSSCSRRLTDEEREFEQILKSLFNNPAYKGTLALMLDTLKMAYEAAYEAGKCNSVKR